MSGTYFIVETHDVNYRTTRRIKCRDLETAYTVAAQLRKRLVHHGYRTLPMPATPILLTEYSDTRGAVACSVWEGRPTLAAAIDAARNAVWRGIDPNHTAGGACVPMPERRGPRMTWQDCEPYSS